MLKTGKIPENILSRSVIKRIHTRDNRGVSMPCVGNDAAIIKIPSNELVTASVKPVIVCDDTDIYRAVVGAINNISAKGGSCVTLQVSLMLPCNADESDVKNIMNVVNSLCQKKDIFVSGGHTEVTNYISKPVLNITAIGHISLECVRKNNISEGDDIVVTKWIGLEGCSIIARNKESLLKSRFSAGFVDRAIAYLELMDISIEAKIAMNNGATAMHDASTGGIFGALWELGQVNNVGMEVDLLSIPLKQETVEICEELELNPYELMSGGCLVITTPRGEQLVDEMFDNGIWATVIGKITKGNDRVLILNDEKRYLEPRRNEELYKII